MPSCASRQPSRNSATEMQLTSNGRWGRPRLRRSQATAGPAMPAASSCSSAIKNEESSSTGATACLSSGVFSQLRLGPIGEIVGSHDLAERAGMNQLGAGDVARAGRGIELLEFGGGVASGNRIRFKHVEILRETHCVVNYGRSAFFRQEPAKAGAGPPPRPPG